MASYSVAFEGKVQCDFDSLADAEEWAEEVAATGRTVFVLRGRWIKRLVRAIPDTNESRRAWRRRGGGPGGPDFGQIPFGG